MFLRATVANFDPLQCYAHGNAQMNIPEPYCLHDNEIIKKTACLQLYY